MDKTFKSTRKCRQCNKIKGLKYFAVRKDTIMPCRRRVCNPCSYVRYKKQLNRNPEKWSLYYTIYKHNYYLKHKKS